MDASLPPRLSVHECATNAPDNAVFAGYRTEDFPFGRWKQKCFYYRQNQHGLPPLVAANNHQLKCIDETKDINYGCQSKIIIDKTFSTLSAGLYDPGERSPSCSTIDECAEHAPATVVIVGFRSLDYNVGGLGGKCFYYTSAPTNTVLIQQPKHSMKCFNDVMDIDFGCAIKKKPDYLLD
jgi:hypothetical protein